MLKQILLLFLVVIYTTSVLADPITIPKLTDDEKEDIDTVLSPFYKLYNFIKTASIVLGLIAVLVAGVVFASAGGDPKKRDLAKQIIGGVIVGLTLVIGAPYLVGYFV